MQRRKFITRLSIGLVSLAGLVAIASYLRQFFPRQAGERRRIPLGRVRQYPVDTYTFLQEHNLFIYRDHEGMKAVTAVCTHLGCIVEKSTEGFECPCHGSCYDNNGEVTAGPAPRNLSWLQVGRTVDGRIYVDPGTVVRAEDKFLIS